MAKIKRFPQKLFTPFHIKNFSCLTPPFQLFDKKSSHPTQYLILNKKVSESYDDHDNYKFFCNKKTEEMRVSNFGGWGKNKDFLPEYLPMSFT